VSSVHKQIKSACVPHSTPITNDQEHCVVRVHRHLVCKPASVAREPAFAILEVFYFTLFGAQAVLDLGLLIAGRN